MRTTFQSSDLLLFSALAIVMSLIVSAAYV